MVILRSLRNYAVTSFQDVSKALTFLERAVQDALNQLQGQSVAVRTSQASYAAQYGQSVFTSGNAVTLPTAMVGGQLISVTNTGSAPLWLYPLNSSETIVGAPSMGLGSKCTIRLSSDGAGGWWG